MDACTVRDINCKLGYIRSVKALIRNAPDKKGKGGGGGGGGGSDLQ